MSDNVGDPVRDKRTVGGWDEEAVQLRLLLKLLRGVRVLLSLSDEEELRDAVICLEQEGETVRLELTVSVSCKDLLLVPVAVATWLTLPGAVPLNDGDAEARNECVSDTDCVTEGVRTKLNDADTLRDNISDGVVDRVALREKVEDRVHE